MSDPVEALILDLLEWIGPQSRPSAEVLECWRTSCPRLPVWEEANQRGFIEHIHQQGQAALVGVSPSGLAWLEQRRSGICAHQQASVAPSNTSVPTQAAAPNADFFRTLEVKRTQALVARDMPVIESLHATDYELISPPGRVMTRERYLSLLAAEPFYANWEHGAMRVRLSEGMAAVRYLARITFPSGKVVDCWHTDIYELQAGSWKAVWSQATQLPTT